MDRNITVSAVLLMYSVALRKESVDRNNLFTNPGSTSLTVALRKESVDRNNALQSRFANNLVALRKESVDRNPYYIRRCLMSVGRSPQGERG